MIMLLPDFINFRYGARVVNLSNLFIYLFYEISAFIWKIRSPTENCVKYRDTRQSVQYDILQRLDKSRQIKVWSLIRNGEIIEIFDKMFYFNFFYISPSKYYIKRISPEPSVSQGLTTFFFVSFIYLNGRKIMVLWIYATVQSKKKKFILI